MDNSILRVLHIASWYPSRLHGTIGNFIERHVQTVHTRCHSTVICFYTEDSRTDVSIERSIENGVSTIRVFHPKRLKLVHRRRSFKKVIEELKQDEVLPFDIVHVHVTFPHGWMARWIKTNHTIPYVITEHWSIYQHPMNISLKQKTHDQLVAKDAAMIMPVTDHLAKSMREFGMKAKYRIVPNVVDTELFHIEPKSADTFQFIHVSSLAEEIKNVSGIINAFHALICSGVEANLKIIGDGDIAPYQNQAMTLGLRGDVFSIHSEMSLTGIADNVTQSNCLVQFSNYENLPCVIIEALASGVPVISTDVGGISEHLTSDRGMLIESGQIDQLMNAMQTMISTYETYDAEALRKYALDHFSIASVSKSYESVYKSVM